MPVLPTVGRGAPTTIPGPGSLQPLSGKTVGITTPVSVRYPVSIGSEGNGLGTGLYRRRNYPIFISGCRVQGAGCRVQVVGCRVQGAGCRV